MAEIIEGNSTSYPDIYIPEDEKEEAEYSKNDNFVTLNEENPELPPAYIPKLKADVPAGQKMEHIRSMREKNALRFLREQFREKEL